LSNSPEISILLPFYNADKTLDRAIESMLNQTFSDFELILINNNSNDRSEDIAANHCKSDHRCKLIQEHKQGIVYAINKGLAQASGKYIARMDADDWSYPERLYLQHQYLETNKSCSVLAGQAVYLPHNKNTEGFERYVNWSNSIISSEHIRLRQFIESPIIHPTVVWRKKISDKHGAFKEGPFPEDYELWLRWLKKGVEFHKLKAPMIKWSDNERRLTRIDDRYSDLAFSKIKSHYLAEWLQANNPFHPKVFVWGASRISRKNAELLTDHGIEISAYIDITSKRKLNRKVMDYRDLPSAMNLFVLVYLGEETMRSNTQQYLEQRGFIEGVNYLLVS